MTARKTILLGALGISLIAAIVVPIIQSRRTKPAPRPKVERDMLGWPIRDISPEQEKRNRGRAMQALREATTEQEAKVTALRTALAGTNGPDTNKQELEHQEDILAAMKRVIQMEFTNKMPRDADRKLADRRH